MTFPLISNDNLFLRINFILLSFMFSYSIFAQINDKELSIQYNSGEFDSVIANATKLLLIEPENPTLNLLLGRSLVEKGLLSDAEPYLLKVIENSESKTWMKAWGMNYFARIQFLLGDKLKSKQYLINCVKLNATNNVTKSSKGMLINLGLDDFYSDFKAVETEHFIFYFQSQTVVTKIEDFIEIREKAFVDITNFFDVKIPKKIDFFVWNLNEDAKQIGLKNLGFAIPEFCVIHSKANQTSGHEITHVITNYLSDNQIKTKFINEGVAVCFDLSNNNRLEIAKQEKVKDSFKDIVSIKKAWKDARSYPDWVYYPLAGEFICRIIDKWGKEKLIELLKNQTYENAVSIYGDKLDAIISELESEIN